MTAPWADWEHVVKLDPDKELYGEEGFDDICATGTDAIEIGGTLGMTEEKMTRFVEPCIEACADHNVACYIEPSHSDVVIHEDALDGFLVPVVLNAGDTFWLTGAHSHWVRDDHDIDWTRTFTEAYIVLNPDSSVAQYTEADCDLGADDVAAYAQVAERMLGQGLVYVEYSGTLGDPGTVAAARDALDEASLFYGGGVGDYESAYEMGQHADTVVVGDLAHDQGADAVRETVEGARAGGATTAGASPSPTE